MALDTGRADWSGTAWHQKDMPAIWAAVADHTPDAYSAHLAGWRRTSELLSQHVARMLAYRENLAAAWNPAHSPAAAVYLARFDADIDNAQRTLDASVANYAAYAAAMNVVSEAQATLRPIQAEYAANAAAEEAHRQVVGGVGYRGGAALAMGRPDVAARQVELTGLARAVMYRASQELIEATAALQVPPAYKNLDDRLRTPPSGINRPIIPPVATRPPSSYSAENSQPNASNAELTDRSNLSPILADSPSERLRETANSQPLNGNKSSVPGPPITPSAIGQIGLGASGPFPLNKAAQDYRSTPIGKVIGSAPGTAQAPGANISPRTTGQANTLLPPLAGQAREQRNAAAGKSLDPDQIWAVERGVHQILAPEIKPERIDPGPAIGLT